MEYMQNLVNAVRVFSGGLANRITDLSFAKKQDKKVREPFNQKTGIKLVQEKENVGLTSNFQNHS